MAAVNIRAHSRGGEKRKSHNVSAYSQNRRDGNKRRTGGKGYTQCQTDIAAVIKRNLPINATVENLRGDPAWRRYVCNCKSSNLYDIATTGVASGSSWFRDNPTVGAGYRFQAPNWRGKGTHEVYIPGKMTTKGGTYATSSCGGLKVFVPRYRTPLTGRQIWRLMKNG